MTTYFFSGVLWYSFGYSNLMMTFPKRKKKTMNFIHQKFPNSFQITFNCELISLRILVHEKFSEHSSRPFARQWIIPSISTLWQQHRNPFITFHEFFAKGSLRMLYFLNKTYNNNSNSNNIDITTSYYNTSGTCNEKLFNYLINVSWRFSFQSSPLLGL